MWTISANTADYFAGYNQFQKTHRGQAAGRKDGTNPVTYLAFKATEEVKTHQPGLSVRVQADCPKGISGRGDPPGVQRHWGFPPFTATAWAIRCFSTPAMPRRTPGLEQLRLRGAPLPEEGVDCGGEHELWLCLGMR